MRSAKIVEVIKTISQTGKGTKEDPVRSIEQYWGKDGKLICTKDYLEDKNSKASS